MIGIELRFLLLVTKSKIPDLRNIPHIWNWLQIIAHFWNWLQRSNSQQIALNSIEQQQYFKDIMSNLHPAPLDWHPGRLPLLAYRDLISAALAVTSCLFSKFVSLVPSRKPQIFKFNLTIQINRDLANSFSFQVCGVLGFWG